MDTRPKVVFLIPIASRSKAKNWSLSCKFLKQTISSIFNSEDENFRVVVVGNEQPDMPFLNDIRFKFLALKEKIENGEKSYWKAAVRDKMVKLAAAWEFARSHWNPEYVMKVDWDDLVSSKIVGWISRGSNEAGFRLKYGWIWRPFPRWMIQFSEQFDRLCGTCLIIRSDLADKQGPFLHSCDGVDLDEYNRGLEKVDKHSLLPGAKCGSLLLNDSHARAEAQFKYLGHKLEVVPFPAAVYRIGHGNNASGQFHQTRTLRMLLGRIRRTRLVSLRLRREFMME